MSETHRDIQGLGGDSSKPLSDRPSNPKSFSSSNPHKVADTKPVQKNGGSSPVGKSLND